MTYMSIMLEKFTIDASISCSFPWFRDLGTSSCCSFQQLGLLGQGWHWIIAVSSTNAGTMPSQLHLYTSISFYTFSFHAFIHNGRDIHNLIGISRRIFCSLPDELSKTLVVIQSSYIKAYMIILLKIYSNHIKYYINSSSYYLQYVFTYISGFSMQWPKCLQCFFFLFSQTTW